MVRLCVQVWLQITTIQEESEIKSVKYLTTLGIWDKQNNTKQSFLKLILRCFSEAQWIEI